MSEKPILFSAPMVRAILAGRKTQTRRLIKFPPWCLENGVPTATVLHNLQHVGGVAYYSDGQPRKKFCLRWAKGGRLWVKETWADFSKPGEHDRLVYRATDTPPAYMAGMSWRPSIYMPRWASRITLDALGVRVERLRDISEGDAIAEGITDEECCPCSGCDNYRHREAYAVLWDKLNAKRATWDSNPWVCVVSFRRTVAGLSRE